VYESISKRAAIDAVMDELKKNPTSAIRAKARIEALPATKPDMIRCCDCVWWDKQEYSLQGRCAIWGIYPTGGWYCANARKEGDK